METQDKLNLIQTIVVDSYKSDKNFDNACAKVVGTEGIGFTEISVLVKKVLVDFGLIIPIKKRKENCIEDISEITEQILEFKSWMAECEELAETHDVPSSFVRKEMKAHYEDQEWDIPKEPNLKGWKLGIVECFKNNPEATVGELEACLMEYVKGVDNAKHYSRGFHEMAKELMKIGLS